MNNHFKNLIKQNIDLVAGGAIVLAIYLSAAFLLPILLNTSTPIAYISSGSMEPTYYTGDLVIIKGVKGEEIQVGDVIVFQPPGYKDLILHRVAAKKMIDGKYYFLTKGDNPKTNKYIDVWGWVPEDRVKGKVIARIPLIGYIFMFVSTTIGKLIILLIIIGLILLDFRENENEEKNARGGNGGYYIIMNKKMKTVALSSIILISLVAVLFTNYIYIGNETPSVSIDGIGTPIKAFSYKVYPLFLTVRSYGLTGGYIKKILITPQRKVSGENSTTVVWSIIYPYVGSKRICLDIFIDKNSTIKEYTIKITYFVVKFGGKTIIFEKVYNP